MDLNCFGKLGSIKGQNGKVAVIGGCFEYTGAPYYAAIAALRSGSDLAHIFCTKSAGIPIKSYSPEIIVHPSLISSQEEMNSDYLNSTPELLENITKWYPAMSSLIVGPGLGRDVFLTETLVPNLIRVAIEQKKILIIDADGINLLCKNRGLVQDYKEAILTPNQIEFKRLWQSVFNTEVPDVYSSETGVAWGDISSLGIKPAVDLAKAMGVHLFVKGKVDVISDGNRAICIGVLSSEKRCGGIGDILSGVIGTTSSNAQRNHCDLLQALALASVLVRKSSLIAFRKHQRSLTAPDIIKALPKALIEILGDYSL